MTRTKGILMSGKDDAARAVLTIVISLVIIATVMSLSVILFNH
jgi:hypothetical protein